MLLCVPLKPFPIQIKNTQCNSKQQQKRRSYNIILLLFYYHLIMYWKGQILLGRLLLSRRMELGLSQEMIAKKAGVLRSTVSRWENNKMKEFVPIPTIHKISIAYDLSKIDIVNACSKKQKQAVDLFYNKAKEGPELENV